MAWTYIDSVAAGDDASATTLAFPVISTSFGDTLIVCSSNYTTGGVLISGVADEAGNVWGKVGTTGGGDANHKIEFWAAPVTTADANMVVTITYAASAAYRKAALFQYSGLVSPAFDAMSAYNTEGSDVTSHVTSPVTTTVAGDLLIGFFINWAGDPGALSGSGNTTLREQTVVTAGNAAGEALAAAPGAYTTQTSSLAGYRQVNVTAAFKIQSAPPPTTLLMGQAGM